jgi:hypothetical protein
MSIVAVVLAMWQAPVQAATHTWNGSASNAWETSGNWTNGTPVSTSGNPDTIAVTTNNPVQINSNVNIGTNALTLGANTSTVYSLNINSGDSFTGGSISLLNGSITGAGAANSSITSSLSGYGSMSGVTFNGGTLTNGTSSSQGISLNNVTLNNATLAGTPISAFTHPLADAFNNNWGNNSYGLFNVSGNSSVTGNFTSGGQQVFDVTNGTLTFAPTGGTIGAFNTSTPPLFVLGANGNVNVVGTTGKTITLGTSAPITMNGGTFSYTPNGTSALNAYAFQGNGTISGPINISGGGSISAYNGNLNVIGGTSAANAPTLGSSSGSGVNLGAGANSTLDLKGYFKTLNPMLLNPTGTTGIVQLDNLNIVNNGTNWSIGLQAGAVNVTNSSSLGGNVYTNAIQSALTIDPSALLTVGGTLNEAGTLQFDISSLSSFGQLDALGASTVSGIVDIDLVGATHAGYYDLFDDLAGITWNPSSLNIIGLAPGFVATLVPEYTNGVLTEEGLQISQTPEPGTMFLLGTGLFGLAALRRRFSRG